jgi:hypothetical protein
MTVAHASAKGPMPGCLEVPPRQLKFLDRTLIWGQVRLRRILREYGTHHNRHRPHRSLDSAALLKPLPEPVDLEQYRVRKQTRVAASDKNDGTTPGPNDT